MAEAIVEILEEGAAEEWQSECAVCERVHQHHRSLSIVRDALSHVESRRHHAEQLETASFFRAQRAPCPGIIVSQTCRPRAAALRTDARAPTRSCMGADHILHRCSSVGTLSTPSEVSLSVDPIAVGFGLQQRTV